MKIISQLIKLRTNTLAIIILTYLIVSGQTLSIDNVCTFHVKGSLFSLIYLEQTQPYRVNLKDNNYLLFNFCTFFNADVCPNDQSAYSILVKSKQQIKVKDYIDQDLRILEELQQTNQEDEQSLNIQSNMKQQIVTSLVKQQKKTIRFSLTNQINVNQIRAEIQNEVEPKLEEQPDNTEEVTIKDPEQIQNPEQMIEDPDKIEIQEPESIQVPEQAQETKQIDEPKQIEDPEEIQDPKETIDDPDQIEDQDENENENENENEDDPQQEETIISYQCQRYSSNSISYLFQQSYNNKTLKLVLLTLKPNQASIPRLQTQFYIECSTNLGLQINSVQINTQDIKIYGKSKSGCPVFQVSSLWSVFQDNWVLFGLMFIVIGAYLLFYGRATLQITVFLSAYFIVFAILAAIATIFISPYSSTFIIYFSFIILLFISTIIAYSITKLLDLSVFFIGALFGMLIGALFNSIFSKLFDFYSVWVLVIFIVIFAIPFGLLTFKFADEIIIASTSLTGAYLVIRPISWIFGGFPNQFLLYHMIQTNEIQTLPWSFFLYLFLILGLAVVGAMYQILKLSREESEQTGQQIEVNFLQQKMQKPLDKIKTKVDGLIDKYRSRENSEEKVDYQELKNSGKYYKMDSVSAYTDPFEKRDIPKSMNQYPSSSISVYNDSEKKDIPKSLNQYPSKMDQNENKEKGQDPK